MALIVDFPHSPHDVADDECCKSVSFYGEVEVKFVRDIALPEYKPDLWYTSKDMDDFKLRSMSVAQAFRQLSAKLKCSKKKGDEGGDSRLTTEEQNCEPDIQQVQEDDDYATLLAAQDSSSSNRGTTFVGLEYYLSTSIIKQKHIRRKRVRQAVLSEQHRQFMINSGALYNATAIAEISERESNLSRQRARIVGLLHHSSATTTNFA